MVKKESFCNRCKKELNWEQKEIIKNLPREELIKLVLGFMGEEKNKK